MPWYSLNEAINKLKVPKEWIRKILVGDKQVVRFILNKSTEFSLKNGRPCFIALDGYLGVNWDWIFSVLKEQSMKLGLKVKYINLTHYLFSPVAIERLVQYSLNKDPYFGYVYEGKLYDFFDSRKIEMLHQELISAKQESQYCAVICYGIGAALPEIVSDFDFIGYFDITREKLFECIERKQVLPLGAIPNQLSAKKPFKRLSYVDHIILNKHKKEVLKKTDWYIEANDYRKLKLIPNRIYNHLLAMISKSPFRFKPIYIPGVWGGQYLKKVRKLPSSMSNCAFCFEVIPQVQAIRIAIDKINFEIPSYNLFWNQPLNILGRKSFKKFGYYFPVTANYDDTSTGGNLAIQDHPNGKYLKNNFNERMCHDESYYVVKAWKGAKTYHGLKDNIDIGELRRLSIRAEKNHIPFDHDQYVNSWPSKPGDLFLIPAGTVHASGANQLVLEIDSDSGWAPTEYTFHIYDYLRKNLDGTLRAIHINHAFAVLRPFRRTNWVGKYLKQKPRLVRKGKGWAEFLIGEYKDMYYKTHRLEFEKRAVSDTQGTFHILVLVEGTRVLVRSQNHPERECVIKFTEGLIVPACLGQYEIINLGKTPCKTTKSFIK